MEPNYDLAAKLSITVRHSVVCASGYSTTFWVINVSSEPQLFISGSHIAIIKIDDEHDRNFVTGYSKQATHIKQCLQRCLQYC